jgi:peptidoglycan/xylan/chitin deacetylase (PgdA/CDA1 family)
VHRQLIRKAARHLGMLALVRRVRASGVRILMYHRFGPDTRGLARQCLHIRRHYHPLALGDVAESYRSGRPVPRNAVVITVDDGYRDFLTCAHPVFRAHDIPTTMFLVSDFIDRSLWLWVDTVFYSVATTRRRRLTIDITPTQTAEFNFETPAQREAVAADIVGLLKEADNDDRVRTLETMVRALDVSLPDAPPDEYAPLTWDEVRTLARQGVEFGAHTKTHPVLSRIADRRAVEEEILASKARIEAQTSMPVLHFCYPNGRRADFDDRAVEVLDRAGFQTAVTTERGINGARTPRFLLRRLGVEPDNPPPYFEELLAGVRSA